MLPARLYLSLLKINALYVLDVRPQSKGYNNSEPHNMQLVSTERVYVSFSPCTVVDA